MIDAMGRAFARAAAQGDPQARERELLARIRAGGRDPRRRPSAGDLVVNVHGSARRVHQVWPLVVAADVGPKGGQLLRGAVIERIELRAGGEWIYVALRTSASARQRDQEIWGMPVWPAGLNLPSAPGCLWAVLNGRWHDELAESLEDRGEDAPSSVEFRWADAAGKVAGPVAQRPLGVWRRWARDGRVLEMRT